MVELEPNEWELEVAEDTRPASKRFLILRPIMMTTRLSFFICYVTRGQQRSPLYMHNATPKEALAAFFQASKFTARLFFSSPTQSSAAYIEAYQDTLATLAESAAILVEDIPLEAGSWEAEKVATLQNELQTLNDVAHQEELQRGHAAEANLVSRAAELQDELSSLGDAVAEEGQGGAAQVDLLRSEGHDSTEGEMSLMDVAAEGAAKQRAAAKGKAGKGPRKGAGGKIGSLKVGKAKGKAAKLAAASVQKTNTKRKNAKVRKSTPGTTGREDYDES